MEVLYNTTIQFETLSYPFDGMFLERANEILGLSGHSLSELSALHEVCEPEDLSRIYQAWYGFMETASFLSVYRKFIRNEIAPLFDKPIYYQKKPGIRAHLNDTLTVQYHTDEWYGHGSMITNFWMPLTKAFSSNSLYVASFEESVAQVKALEFKRATMSEINSRLRDICSPVEMAFGDVHIFGGQVVHGTERNETGFTRVSLDFRILSETDNPGSKPIAQYYESTRHEYSVASTHKSTSEQALRTTSFVLTEYGFTKHISTYQQRLLCVDYARRNNLELVAEETEIKTMPHGPMLLSLADGRGTHDITAVLIYSVMCLPPQHEDRARIYSHAARSGVRLYFANEDIRFDGPSDSDFIEQTRARITGTQVNK